MADVIYKSSMGDKLCKLLVCAGITYGAFIAGEKAADVRHDMVPYSVMKSREGYFLIEKKTDSFRKIDETLFEKITMEKDVNSKRYEYGPLLPKRE